MSKEISKVNNKPENTITVTDIQLAVRYAISEVVEQSVYKATKPLNEKLNNIQENMNRQDIMLKEHYELVDKRLRQLIEEKRRPKSLFERLFS